MDDELVYSAVTFNRSDNGKPEVSAAVQQDEEVVYSEVRRQKDASSHTCTKTSPGTHLAANVETALAPSTPYRQTMVCLGMLCLVLLAGVVAVLVFNIIQGSQYNTLLALYTNETTAQQKLQLAKVLLEREKQELTEYRDQLDTVLRIIIQFSKIPASALCRLTDDEIHCEPCLKNWIQNGSSCYYFYMKDSGWKTWQDSRQHCLDMEGDLAIINSTEEQEFINQHTRSYYDEYHGYWIGLTKQNRKWVWTTGTALQTGLWAAIPEYYDNCALSDPRSTTPHNWMARSCYMYNRWICKMRAVPWPSQMKAGARLPSSPPPSN